MMVVTKQWVYTLMYGYSPSDTKCDFVLLMVQTPLKKRNRLKKSLKMCEKDNNKSIQPNNHHIQRGVSNNANYEEVLQ